MNMFIGVSIANFACAVVTYIVLGGYKLRRSAGEAAAVKEHFTKEQTISLVALLIMVVMVVGFSYDVGLICFTLSLVLILLRTADEKKAIKMIPWNVLILIAGVSVLMNITQTMGGIELLSDILASFMNSTTAAPLMGFTGGLMSWFSSANGVVFPTLIPTVPDISAQVGGASVMQMIVAIVCSATVAGTVLCLQAEAIMASYTQESGCDEKEQQKLFGQLFMLSAGMVALVFVLTLAGLLKFLG